jgi:hypothetical protein
VKYRFEESRIVREDAVYVVAADSLQEACRRYDERRMAGEPPDDGEGEVIDSELVSVTDECGDSHLDQALDYIYADEDHCEVIDSEVASVTDEYGDDSHRVGQNPPLGSGTDPGELDHRGA